MSDDAGARGVFQVAQRAVDLDRAQEFYSWLLGAEPTGRFDPPGLLFFQVGPTRLLLERGAPSALLYLQVDDVRTTVERCIARGVAVESEPHVIFRHEDASLGPAGTEEWMAFVTDSEGNTVGLVSHTPG
jgi:methylmalonyl-CoA/ethylmalonyl-CoA epimerase